MANTSERTTRGLKNRADQRYSLGHAVAEPASGLPTHETALLQASVTFRNSGPTRPAGTFAASGQTGRFLGQAATDVDMSVTVR